jgi:hypothetical protein
MLKALSYFKKIIKLAFNFENSFRKKESFSKTKKNKISLIKIGTLA